MQRNPMLSALCVSVALVSACAESPTQPIDSGLLLDTHQNPVVGSASGSGHTPCATIGPFGNCDPTNPDGGLRTFSFTAQMHADGSVSGRAQLKNREDGSEGKADVVCLRFTRDNRAWMIAEITHSPSPGDIGQLRSFAVEDNGEGSNADPDRMINVFPANNPGLVCAGNAEGDAFLNALFDNPLLSYEIVNGDTQVRAP